jgi:formate dehydrogenase iron-sulfur subunit
MHAILFDANLCVGCESCLEACREKNGLEGKPEDKLSATTYTILEERGDDSYLRRMCMHCIEPSCASACPVKALHKTPEGPVVYEYERCIGCRYCMVACPFEIPRYEWSSLTPRVKKCEQCHDRVAQGLPTACAEACPTEATISGDRVDLIAEAWRRIAEDPENYAPRVYGLQEVGGTGVLIIGSKEVLEGAFNERIPDEALPEKTWVVLSKIPTTVAVMGAGMLGVHWVIRRRMELARGSGVEGEEAVESGATSEDEHHVQKGDRP